MMSRLLVALLVLALLVGCAPRRTDPSISGPYTESAALIAARQEAIATDGLFYHITCCGSMLPLIKNGDYVLVRKVPLTDALIGHVVAYRPKWYGGGVIVHRIVGTIANGYIGEGDARIGQDGRPITPETSEPITDATFIGEVTTIYSVTP